MSARFIQIHTLTSYPASLLNRDDAGFAKRMPFGGAVRTRVSSQCLKRHWRVYDGEHSLAELKQPESVRSRVSFERFLVEPLVKDGVSEELARAAGRKLVGICLGSEQKKEKAEKKGGKKKEEGAAEAGEPVKTAQVTVIGRPELDYLLGLAREAISAAGKNPEKVEDEIEKRMKDKKLKENLKALMPGSLEAGLGAALFGRMVTGDVLARTDAAIHVAHAVTVHAQLAESDYFSAIDDLIRDEGEAESGHINASELTSGLFYGYVVVDVNGLNENLGGDRNLAADVISKLVHMVATVSPGAKKGSTAPYAYSHFVLAESGKAQPRTLQNAFLEPVRTSGDLVENAYRALKGHLDDLDGMYGKTDRQYAGLRAAGHFGQGKTLAELADWTKSKVIE